MTFLNVLHTYSKVAQNSFFGYARMAHNLEKSIISAYSKRNKYTDQINHDGLMTLSIACWGRHCFIFFYVYERYHHLPHRNVGRSCV